MKNVKLLLLVVVGLFLAGCNTLQQTDDLSRQYSADPWQGFNRGMHKFNETADRIVLKPVATGYSRILPSPAKTGVRNFFNNLSEPLNAANNLLQGKLVRAASSVARFAINSSIGIGGLFDVASGVTNISPANEDFGQTLAAWGVRPGPYLVLPLFGPSNLRDGLGRIGEGIVYYANGELTDSSSGRIGLSVLDAVDTRARLLGTDSLLDAQLDPYAFIKSSYEQNRIQALYDGSPPVSAEQLESDF
ncbi:MAG: VacJ family lipoprotein [Arenicella sp.]|nr:VacJ family lipoprotein [Arenicella sp.]